MQIHTRPIVVYQLILFCLLSPYYLHITESLVHGVSSLDLHSLREFILSHPLVLALAVVSGLLVWRLSKFARVMASLLAITTLSMGMTLALKDMSKIVLIMSFIYAVAAYYLLMLYRVENNSAAYNPLYSDHTIGRRSEYELTCIVRVGEEAFHGQLTNWDETGCFISINLGEGRLADIRGNVSVEVWLDGHAFIQIGNVVSSYEHGLGIRFTHATKDVSAGYNWLEYYKIIDDRGYVPRSREA